MRLDRVLDVPEEGIRREGAILERETFDIVAGAAARRVLLELTCAAGRHIGHHAWAAVGDA